MVGLAAVLLAIRDAGLDPAGFAASEAQLHEVLPSVSQLGKAMRSYGAVSCGQIMGYWAGDKTATKSGGGVTAT